MIAHMLTTVKISSYICWLSLCYRIGNKTRLECIKSTVSYLTSLNIVYSKIFQALSSGISFLSLEEMEYLSQYNDNAPYYPNEEYNIYDIIENLNSNSNHKDVLILKPGSPVNSGIISIVYYGRLGETDIVIKVKRRGIREKIDDGIGFAEFISFISNYIPYINKLNIQNVVQENKDSLRKQCDFNIELSNINEFKHMFRNIDYITIPEPYDFFTKINDNVIVMQQLKGYRMNDYVFSSNPELKLTFAKLISKFIVKCIFFDKMFHADLHIGNVFFDNSNKDKPKLGIIDFGLVNNFTKHMQSLFCDLFKYIIVDEDFSSAAKLMILHFIVPIQHTNKFLLPIETQELIDKLMPLVKEIFELSDNGVATIAKINEILMSYDMHMSRDFYNIYVALIMSAGICNSLCDKDTKFLHIVKEVIKDMFSIVEIDSL